MSMATPGASDRRRTSPLPGRVSRGRGLLSVVVLVLASALVVVSPWEQGKAVRHGKAAKSDAAQVRILENGVTVGGGTLVARNWALTALHLFSDTTNPSTYSLRFGVVDESNDATDRTTLRTIDRIEMHENLPDLALVHFADPVPEGTWIPGLATRAPSRLDIAHMYGWGSGGDALSYVSTLVLDPAASANAAYLRPQVPSFDAAFPEEAPPMVLNALGQGGDSGSGIFSPREVLSGVHAMFGHYREANSSGNLYGSIYWSSYEQPVWRYRDWIQRVIDGEGTSGSNPTDEKSARRRLTEAADGDLSMTLPPPTDTCEPGQTPCDSPEATWGRATLLGLGNYRGTAQAVCVQTAENTCSFDGTAYAAGATARLPLGPSRAKDSPGTREVMVWCQASNTFSEGGPLSTVLRVSFTNADPDEVPAGMGWWDVKPDQVGTGAGQTLVDPDRFAAC